MKSDLPTSSDLSNLLETSCKASSSSLINRLYEEGAFLHEDFRPLAKEQGVEFVKKATDLLFKLPSVNSSL